MCAGREVVGTRLTGWAHLIRLIASELLKKLFPFHWTDKRPSYEKSLVAIRRPPFDKQRSL